MKRMLSVLFAVCLLFSVAAFAVSAAVIVIGPANPAYFSIEGTWITVDEEFAAGTYEYQFTTFTEENGERTVTQAVYDYDEYSECMLAGTEPTPLSEVRTGRYEVLGTNLSVVWDDGKEQYGPIVYYPEYTDEACNCRFVTAPPFGDHLAISFEEYDGPALNAESDASTIGSIEPIDTESNDLPLAESCDLPLDGSSDAPPPDVPLPDEPSAAEGSDASAVSEEADVSESSDASEKPSASRKEEPPTDRGAFAGLAAGLPTPDAAKPLAGADTVNIETAQEPDGEGFPTWAIVLIAVAGAAVAADIALIPLKRKKQK